MKIISVLGSPRINGNTSFMAKRFCEVAERQGAQVETFALNKMSYRGCQGCMACKTKLDHCILNDDLTPLLNGLASADILLMASPVYYGDVTSQMKGFIDRCYSLLTPDYMSNPKPYRLPDGKRMAFLMAQGYPDEKEFADIFPKYNSFYQWHGFKSNHVIRACGAGEPGAVAKMPDILKEVESLAQKLVG